MTKEKMKALFTIAGLEVLNEWELANRYWPRPRFEAGREQESLQYAKLREQSPWWLVKTPYGLIEIGWRKRVISISWLDTGLCANLTADPVTKADYYVHADTELKAAEYLTALAGRLREFNPQPARGGGDVKDGF